MQFTNLHFSKLSEIALYTFKHYGRDNTEEHGNTWVTCINYNNQREKWHWNINSVHNNKIVLDDLSPHSSLNK